MNLSVNSILKKIYAASAMRSFMSQGDKQQILPILTPDNSLALRSLIDDAVSYTVISLAPRITAVKRSDDNDIITLSIGVPIGLDRLDAFETAVADQTLSLIFSGIDQQFSRSRSDTADRIIGSLAAAIDSASLSGAGSRQVVPHRF